MKELEKARKDYENITFVLHFKHMYCIEKNNVVKYKYKEIKS